MQTKLITTEIKYNNEFCDTHCCFYVSNSYGDECTLFKEDLKWNKQQEIGERYKKCLKITCI